MRIHEVSATYETPNFEYALMTLPEFIKHRNPTGAKFSKFSHHTDSIPSMNTNSPHATVNGEFVVDGITYIRQVGITVGKLSGNVLTTIPGEHEFGHIPHSSTRVARSIPTPWSDEMLEKLTPVRTITVGGRKVSIYKNPGLYGDAGLYGFYKNFMVGQMVSQRSGTLVVVADELRGTDLARIMSDLFYPEYAHAGPSGGFTADGEKNAIRIWVRRVRKFLAAGWYTELIRKGETTIDRVREIIRSLPTQPVAASPKSETFILSGDFYAAAFDGRALSQDEDDDDLVDPRYGLAMVELKKNDDGQFEVKTAVSRSGKFDKLAIRLLLQLAYLHKTPINIGEYSPEVVFDGFEDHISTSGSVVEVTTSLIDFSKYEYPNLQSHVHRSIRYVLASDLFPLAYID